MPKVKLTPEMARDYLKSNTRNRPLRQSHIIKLARDMVAKRWVYNGESIKFAKDGSLIDGQHRLHAIIRAGVAVETEVVTDLDTASFYTIDSGLRRKTADYLSLDHGIVNAFIVANAGRMIVNYLTGRRLGEGVQPSEVMAFFERDNNMKEIEELCREAKNTSKANTFIPYGTVAAVAWLGSRGHGLDKAYEFVHGLTTGLNLQEGDPRYALRNIFLGVKSGGRTRDYQWAMACTTSAWNAFVRGQKLFRMSPRRSDTGGWKLYRIDGAPNPSDLTYLSEHDAEEPSNTEAVNDITRTGT